MNSNELMKDLYKTLRLSGWLDKATEYFQEHTERFEDCVYGDGKIANIDMSISYQPESLSAVTNMKPNVFVSIGRISTDKREFNVYDNDMVKSRTWIDDKLVIDDVKVINGEINKELCTHIVWTWRI